MNGVFNIACIYLLKLTNLWGVLYVYVKSLKVKGNKGDEHASITIQHVKEEQRLLDANWKNVTLTLASMVYFALKPFFEIYTF